MRFQATLERSGRTATGIEVPADVVTGLGSHKRPPVTVTINGYRYRSTVATMGGRYLIPVSAEVRRNAGVEAGDELDVDVELDDRPREVTVPGDLAAALDAEPAARAAFDALTYSNQRAHVLSVEGAKAAETRAHRVAKIVEALRG
jgi:bifunctional DNA-binding transcriptional regulator/antitoxin component of YhaV-PrlF toxin-antitoxin module